MSIGEKIKKARNERNLTQEQLASRANISRSYLGDLEGDRYNPSLDTLKSIASVLGVDVSTFISDADAEIKFNSRDQRDIAKSMEEFREKIMTNEGLMFDGEPLSPEAADSILSAIQMGLEIAKVKNKEKYTPKKYKKSKDQ